MYIYVILILAPAITLTDYIHEHMEEALFATMDVNKDGFLSPNEFESIFQGCDSKLEIDKGKLTTCIKSVGSAFLGEEEELFHLLDQDSNGIFSSDDIFTVFNLFDTNIDNLLHRWEFHDGYQEIVRILEEQRPSHKYTELENQSPTHEEI